MRVKAYRYLKGKLHLKMLCLYLDTLIIGHIFCSMISILNELTLQTGIAKNVNNTFLNKRIKNTTITNIYS